MNNQYFVFPMMFASPFTNYGWIEMGVHIVCVLLAIILLILPERIFPTKPNHASLSLAAFGIGQMLYAVAAITRPFEAEQMRMWAALLHFTALTFWTYGVFKPVCRQLRRDRKISKALRNRTEYFK